jgi:CheY-like chemotaxis protein
MSQRRLKIMLVEDDLTVANTVMRVLQEQYDVQVAPSDKSARALARTSRPDLILCDASLATAEGSNLIAALKKITDRPNIPVVLMSGYLLESELVGAAAFIQKPFSPAQIFSTLDQATREIVRKK